MSRVIVCNLVRTTLVGLLCAALAGCHHATVIGGGMVSTDRGQIFIDGPHRLKIEANGTPTAIVTDKPALLISGQPVALNASQRRALMTYYNMSRKLGKSSENTGRASMSMVGNIFHDTTNAITGRGNGESLQKNIKDRVSHFLNENLGPICDSLAAELRAQNQLKKMLPVFAPYAILENDNVAHCRSDLDDAKMGAS